MLVELNEFDPEHLRRASERLNLANIRTLLTLNHGETTTEDKVEHQGLDPWVQWVNVHCGRPSSTHNVKRLGETAGQRLPQIWTALGETGHTWGVWGAMNAPRQDAPGCQFFFPDPWSFEEDAYPASLNHLLSLPRYMSKNYLAPDALAVIGKALRFAARLLAPDMMRTFVQFAQPMLAQAARARLSIHALTVLLDYLSVLVFVDLRRKTKPDFSLIFLNNIAHLQHQFWHAGDAIHHEMEFGLRLTDTMLGCLMADLAEDESLIVMNGLKQKNVEGRGICVYRQKQPQAMIDQLGVVGGHVEQCMTNDAHILFHDSAAADDAEERLRQCTLSDGAHAFYVERLSPTRVFYQTEFEHEVANDASLVRGDTRIPFSDLFELYARRTGAHVSTADIYARGLDLPASMPNHEVYDLILRHFGSHANATPLLAPA